MSSSLLKNLARFVVLAGIGGIYYLSTLFLTSYTIFDYSLSPLRLKLYITAGICAVTISIYSLLTHSYHIKKHQEKMDAKKNRKQKKKTSNADVEIDRGKEWEEVIGDAKKKK